MKKNLFAIALTATVLLSACGGGGSSDDSTFVGAADVSVSTQPSQIDSGDRTEVTVTVWNVHENGIALKVRFPEGLGYVPGSAVLLIENKEIDLTPQVNALVADEQTRYLVFFISQSSFRINGQEYTGGEGTVVLQLEGLDGVTDGLIEVDPDVDDPAEANDTEFSLEDPQFVAEAEASITVVAE